MADNKRKEKIFFYFAKTTSSKKSRSPITIMPQKRKTRLKSEMFLENLSSAMPDGEYDIKRENFDLPQPKTPETYKTPPKNDVSPIQSNQVRRRSTRLKSEVLDRSSLNDLSENIESTESKTSEAYKTPLKNDTKLMKSLPAQRRSTRLKSEVLDRSSLNDISENIESTQSKTSETYKTLLKNDTKLMKSLPAQRRSTRLRSEFFDRSSLKDLSENFESTQSKTSETYKTPLKNDANILQSIPGRRRSNKLKSEVLDSSFLKGLTECESVITGKPVKILNSEMLKKDKHLDTSQNSNKNNGLKIANKMDTQKKINNSDKDSSLVTPTNNQVSPVKPTPARRLTRSRSVYFDRSCLNDLPVENNTTSLNNESNLITPQNIEAHNDDNLRKKAKKRKMSTQELTENLLETIDTNAIADMLVASDMDKGNAQTKQRVSKKQRKLYNKDSEFLFETIPNNYENCIRLSQTKEQTENSNTHQLNGHDISIERNKKKISSPTREEQNGEEMFSSRCSIKIARRESVSYYMQDCENNLDIRKSSMQAESCNIHLQRDQNVSSTETNHYKVNNINIVSPTKDDKNVEEISFRKRRNSIKVTNSELSLKHLQVTIDGLKNLDITSQTSGTDVDTNVSQNNARYRNVNLKKRTKKRKISCQEIAENLVETIDTSAIVDMLISTNTDKVKELANQNDSSRQQMMHGSSESLIEISANKNEKRVKAATKTNKKLAQTESCNKRSHNNIDNTLNKNDNPFGKNKKGSTPLKEDNREKIFKKKLSSTKVASNELLRKNPPINENNDGLNNSSQTEIRNIHSQNDKSLNITEQRAKDFKRITSNGDEITFRKRRNSIKVINNNKSLNNSLTNKSNQKDIMSYFKVQNKQINENIKCSKLPNKKINEKQNTMQPVLDSDNLNKSNAVNDQRKPTETVKKRGRPQLATQRVKKINVAKTKAVNKYTKISKMTKEQAKNVKQRKIPKDRLDDVLNMMDNDDHPMWEDRNISCNPYIFQHWQPRAPMVSDQNIKLKLARQFILRRDWMNLSKVLGLFNATAKNYYPLLAKYAALLLGYTDKEHFATFIQFLTKFNDSSAIIKKCTKLSTEDEE